MVKLVRIGGGGMGVAGRRLAEIVGCEAGRGHVLVVMVQDVLLGVRLGVHLKQRNIKLMLYI